MVKRICLNFLISIGFGFLVFPFTGFAGAAKTIAAVVLVRFLYFSFIRSVTINRWAGILSEISVSPRLLNRLRNLKWPGFSLLFILPIFLNNYQVDVITLAGLYVFLALGLNIVVGFVGMLDLGYAAFYAIGAYSYALLSTHVRIDFWIMLPLGAIISASAGLFLGVITLRLKGDYLAIVTLGFIQIIHLILNNWDSVTNGPKGILGIRHPAIGSFLFSRPIHYFYLILILIVSSLYFLQKIYRSRFGRAWSSIREDEIAAAAMGINVTRMKILAFVIGSAWAGVGGVFFAGKFGFVSPESFTFFESILILSMVVLGGIGSVPGVILGALILILLPELLRSVADYRMVVFGAAMVLMMALKPEGILGGFKTGLK